jgi:predicted DNA-binding transcriptional regulator YafY
MNNAGKLKTPQPLEQHWRVAELASRLHVSQKTARRMVEDRPGVKIYGETRGTKTKRRYRTILIPQSVVDAICRELDMNY